MADYPFNFKLIGKELRLLVFVAAILLFEILTFAWLAYSENIEIFISYFIIALQLLTPVFLWLNGIIIISTMFVRRKNLIIQPWTTYLKEILSFSLVSSVLTIIFLGISCSLGVMAVLLLKRMAHVPTVESIISSLRHWVRLNFY